MLAYFLLGVRIAEEDSLKRVPNVPVRHKLFALISNDLFSEPVVYLDCADAFCMV
jgi:hypothetical protein